MATTRLTDVEFDADVYASIVTEMHPDQNAFVQSGVAVTNETLNSRAQGEGDLTTVPYWKDLDYSNENISNDNPADSATPEKITMDKMQARRVHINNGWETANLVSSIMGAEDPMTKLATMTNGYWNNRFAARLIDTMKGVYLANDAGAGDMIIDLASESIAGQSPSTLFNRDGFVEANGTMGENQDKLALLCVHPDTLTQMQKQNQIDFVTDALTGIRIPFYGEKRVYVDKKLPVIAGATDGFKYVSMLLQGGCVGYGEGTPHRPVGIEYDEKAGNGAGIETLFERKQWIIQPEGHNWNEASVAGASPTTAEVALAANWTRKFDRENVGMAFYIHN